MLLSLAIALNLGNVAPQSEIVVTFHPSKVMAKKFMIAEQTANVKDYKPTIPMDEGELTVDGKTYKLYMAPKWNYDVAKKRDWNAVIGENALGIFVDYDDDGDLSVSERWLPHTPIRFGSKMLKATSIANGEVKFVPVDGPAMGGVEGQAAPDFDWTDMDGKAHRLQDYRGKYLILDMFSITCVNCMEEWPHILEIQKKFGEDRLKVLLLSSDVTYASILKDVPQRNKDIAKSRGMPWPNVLVPGGWDELIPKFNAYGYGLYLIGPDGTVLMARDRAPRLEKILGGIK